MEYCEMCYQALRTAYKDKRRVKEDYTPGMEQISSEECKRSDATIPKRCVEVIKNKGSPTKYRYLKKPCTSY